MLEKTLKEVVQWAQSLDLPVVAVTRGQESSATPGFRYRTLLNGERMVWIFDAAVPQAIPLLLTRVAAELVEAREERFLLAGLVHELRNPLAVLAGHTDLLAKELEPMGPNAHVTGIQRAVERMAHRLTRASHQYDPPARTLISLKQVWEDVVADLEPEWIARNIEWTFRGNAGWIETDPWRLEQILFNLAKNAVEAYTEGGLIRVDCYHLCDDLVLRVFNQGKPLNEEQRKHLFRPLSSEKGHGHGLGLAVSQRLAQTIGGKIVYLPEKEGVSFMLVL